MPVICDGKAVTKVITVGQSGTQGIVVALRD